MRIGIAGPMSLDLLKEYLPSGAKLPQGYPFPMISVLIKEIIKRGYHVTAYTTSENIDQPIVFKCEKLTLCIARRKPHSGRNLFVSERSDLLKLIKENPVDVINAQWSYEFAWAAIDSGIPTLVTLQDHAYTILKYQFDAYRIVRLLMNYIILGKAKYLISNSEYLYNLLSEVNKKKTIIIPNFYNEEIDSKYDEKIKKSNYIVSVSNGFGVRKNISNGLIAFSNIKKKHPDFEYHLIGDGMEEGGPAFLFAKGKRLLDGVKFIGAIPFSEVIEEIKKAIVCLHPSLEESFGMSVLESQVLGTAVVGGQNSGNIPYLLEQGNTGYLCDVEKPNDIAKILLETIEYPTYRQKIEGRARELAFIKYSSAKIVPLYLEEFKRIVG